MTKLLLLYCTELYGSNGGWNITRPEGFFSAMDPGVMRYYFGPTSSSLPQPPRNFGRRWYRSGRSARHTIMLAMPGYSTRLYLYLSICSPAGTEKFVKMDFFLWPTSSSSSRLHSNMTASITCYFPWNKQQNQATTHLALINLLPSSACTLHSPMSISAHTSIQYVLGLSYDHVFN